MTRVARVALLAVALAGGLAGGLAGCKKKAKAPPAAVRVPPMPEAEVTRGKAACDDLVAKLCACSAAQPGKAELAEACQMKKAKPEALALALETAVRDDVGRSQQAARTIIEKCVQEVAALPTLGCR